MMNSLSKELSFIDLFIDFSILGREYGGKQSTRKRILAYCVLNEIHNFWILQQNLKTLRHD